MADNRIKHVSRPATEYLLTEVANHRQYLNTMPGKNISILKF